MRGPEKLEVSSNGVRLFAERWGASGPTLILGHGFGGSARNFRPQARALAPEHRVVLFDARGHARSDAPDVAERYAPASFVGDLAAVLDACGVERAVVGGLSMGAGIALRFALAHPERTLGLVLAAFPRSVEDAGHVPWALGFADALEQRGIDAGGREYIWGRLDAKAADWVRRGFEEHRPAAIAHVLRELIAVQPSPVAMAKELAAFELPALVLVGTQDAGSLGPSRELARRMPRAELVEIAGGGHIVNLSNPHEVNAALKAFLGRFSGD